MKRFFDNIFFLIVFISLSIIRKIGFWLFLLLIIAIVTFGIWLYGDYQYNRGYDKAREPIVSPMDKYKFKSETEKQAWLKEWEDMYWSVHKKPEK